MKISAILPARNEGEQVQQTIDSLRAAGVQEIILVDDASDDGSCCSLTGVTTQIFNPEARCPSYCRNIGAYAASGDVLIFADAHVRATDVKAFAQLALDKRVIVNAAVKPLGGRDWTGYGGVLVKEAAGYDAKYQMKKVERGTQISAVIGAFYAMSHDTFDYLGGWPRTISHGYNEQALSLAATMSGIPMIVDSDTAIFHMFKHRFNYPTRQSSSRINRFLVHYQLFDDYEDHWKPILEKAFPEVLKTYQQHIDSREVQRAREHYKSIKKITDQQFYEATT